MFPPTDSAKSGDDVFPTTNNVKDIKPPRSLQAVRAIYCIIKTDEVAKKFPQLGVRTKSWTP